MGKILDLVDFKLIITAEALAIYPFSELWKRDKTKDKSNAYNDITSIWYMVDYNSPYFSFTDSQKDEHIRKDIIRDSKYKPDATVLAGLETYKDLTVTPAMKMLEAAEVAIRSTEKYLKGVDYTLMDNGGKFLYDIDKVQNAIIKMPKAMAAINEAKDLCKKEQSSGVKVRGDKSVGIFEE